MNDQTASESVKDRAGATAPNAAVKEPLSVEFVHRMGSNSDQADLQIRPMRVSDVDSIIPIENTIYPFPWTAGNFRDSLAARYSGWVLQQAPRTSAAAGVLVGYAMLMHVLDEAHLMNLSIKTSEQRRGLGSQFLERLFEQSRRQGADGMFLEVRPSNLAAIALYERTGFQRIGVRRNYYPNGDAGREDAVVMRLSLHGADSQ